MSSPRSPRGRRRPAAGARQLAAGRAGVAWEAVGIALAAYEHALAYCNGRTQFGRPITSFQLVQEQLVVSAFV